MIWPREADGPLAHRDMPANVRELYEEARLVAPLSRRASAALARASLERLLRTLDDEAPAKARLDERIARLAPKVSSALARNLTVLRYIGNDALHGTDEEAELVALYLDASSEAGIADVIFSAINELVDELITKPAEAERLFMQLPEGVRTAAERKAKAAGEDITK
ncbi:DUF4145 domain-containing protein [Frigoribacterium sp. MEB024]|uniref:DUF4145 domain-containing protein n=1 Tax=Frigoribacterium sp. MEB024 TaxID=1589899 RepID=UPI001E35CD40|nr:DUF4145 domain-containing protein [Frigoribacterium sp. MEB024]